MKLTSLRALGYPHMPVSYSRACSPSIEALVRYTLERDRLLIRPLITTYLFDFIYWTKSDFTIHLP